MNAVLICYIVLDSERFCVAERNYNFVISICVLCFTFPGTMCLEICVVTWFGHVCYIGSDSEPLCGAERNYNIAVSTLLLIFVTSPGQMCVEH